MSSDNPKMVAGIIDNLRRVFQVVNEQSKQVERETGLTGPQLWAMKVIGTSAPIRVLELARLMYLHPATVVGIINRLETKGLVLRTRSLKDRRAVNLELTCEGKSLVAQAPEVIQGLLVKGLEILPRSKREQISEGLEHLVAILGAQEIPPQLILSSEVNQPLTEDEPSDN